MNAKEFQEFTRGKNPVVVFHDAAAEQESCVGEGWRGRLLSVQESRFGDGMLEFEFDLEPFRAINEPLAKANYYDRNGKAGLTVFETSFYTGMNYPGVNAGVS